MLPSHDRLVEMVFLDEHTQALEAAGGGGQVGDGARLDELPSFPLEMSTEVPAGTTDRGNPHTTEVRVPFPAKILEVDAGRPPGADDTVGFRLLRGTGESIIPRNEAGGFISPAGTSKTYPINGVELEENEVLRAEFLNFDAAADHFMNVQPTVIDMTGAGGVKSGHKMTREDVVR